MSLREATHPFRFASQTSLVELTGLEARDVTGLLAVLRTVPGGVIYYHTHHFLKVHQYFSPEPPNDFAYWVTEVLQENRVGEQLASIDTIRFSSLQTLRDALVEVIERYQTKTPSSRVAPLGEEFHFRKARSFVFQTPFEAKNLEEFEQVLHKISLDSLYHHIFAARLRLGKGVNDFSYWLENELGESALAKAISRLDPYTQSLEGLRRTIIRLAQARLSSYGEVAAHAS